MQTARQIPLCVLFCRRYSFLLYSCKFDFSLCLSFSLPPSVSFLFCICLHLPRPPLVFCLSLRYTCTHYTHTHTHSHTHTHIHTHTQSQTLSLVVEFIVWSVSSFSPSVLPFVFCMFCCTVQGGRDADRMQTVCPQWRVRTSTVGIYLTKHINLFTQYQMYNSTF